MTSSFMSMVKANQQQGSVASVRSLRAGAIHVRTARTTARSDSCSAHDRGLPPRIDTGPPSPARPAEWPASAGLVPPPPGPLSRRSKPTAARHRVRREGTPRCPQAARLDGHARIPRAVPVRSADDDRPLARQRPLHPILRHSLPHTQQVRGWEHRARQSREPRGRRRPRTVERRSTCQSKSRR